MFDNNALFWNTILGGLQTAALMALGRIFDQQSEHNVDTILRLAQDNSRAAWQGASKKLVRKNHGSRST